MDVGMMARTQASAITATPVTDKTTKAAQTNASAQSAADAKEAAIENSADGAYKVELSGNAAKTASTTDVTAAASAQNDAIKGLTDDQLKVLQEGIDKSYQLMIKTLTEQNVKLQGYVDEGIGKLNFDGVLVDAAAFALPEVATTPEEAAKAVADGGDWSVGAVSDRIFGLAETLAGGDPERLEKMRAAVEEGFKQAGIAFKDATGAKDMPQITKDTHAEIMKRFDDLYAKLTGTAKTNTDEE